MLQESRTTGGTISKMRKSKENLNAKKIKYRLAK
jgi:hypothetical protein